MKKHSSFFIPPPSFSRRLTPLHLIAGVSLLVCLLLASLALAFPAPPQHVLDAPEPIAYRATP